MNDRIEQDWTAVCELDDIVPDTGVCALVKGTQVAVFHVPGEDAGVYAIDNYDPHSQAAVLSRGIVGSLGERIVVASPIYKQHFDLRTGECLETPELSVSAYRVKVAGGKVWIAA
jgi:nitrite reductase (NADH) small subunit